MNKPTDQMYFGQRDKRYPNHPKAKIMDLNKILNMSGIREAKFQEGDIFISKKILMNLGKVYSYDELVSLDKFKENVKKVVDLKSEKDGNILYKFENAADFITQDVVEMNYIYHHKDNVWIYYQEKEKEKEIIPKKRKGRKAKAK